MPYAPKVICCSKCNEHKPIEEFYGILHHCKSCYNLAQKQSKQNRKALEVVSNKFLNRLRAA